MAKRAVGHATERKYHSAMSSFCEFLILKEVLQANPMHAVMVAKQPPPRMRSLEQHEVTELAEAQREPYRSLSALLHGTGLEISTALGLKRCDIDVVTHELRAKGTKTDARDRQVFVADWAWPYLETQIRNLLPNALVFGGVNRWKASDQHRAACKRIGIEDYRLPDNSLGTQVV